MNMLTVVAPTDAQLAYIASFASRQWQACEDALAEVRAEVERLTAQLDGVHLALAEANIERAAGVDEPLWSEQHRVRLLAAQRDALAAQLEAAEQRTAFAWQKCYDAEQAHDALAAQLAEAQQALAVIQAKQPATLQRLRDEGVIFDEKPHRDPSNWQQVAFWIYTDLCEVESIASAALAVSPGEPERETDSGGTAGEEQECECGCRGSEAVHDQSFGGPFR